MWNPEYRGGRYALDHDFANLVLIGGPTVNKLVKRHCIHNGTSSPAQAPVDASLRCRSPAVFEVVGEDESALELRGFRIGPHSFNHPDDAAIFTLPIARPSDVDAAPADLADSTRGRAGAFDQVGLAVCLHATSAAGYMQLSRLAWPVVPPMVSATEG